MVLGSWVAVFPGILERLSGHSYSVVASYGVSRVRFEVFTLGTLAVILVFGLIGYALAADVRAKAVDIPLEAGLEPAAGD
jgi:1,4-dihydroxy-2-naphthoate octaprenyltransferase